MMPAGVDILLDTSRELSNGYTAMLCIPIPANPDEYEKRSGLFSLYLLGIDSLLF